MALSDEVRRANEQLSQIQEDLRNFREENHREHRSIIATVLTTGRELHEALRRALAGTLAGLRTLGDALIAPHPILCGVLSVIPAFFAGHGIGNWLQSIVAEGDPRRKLITIMAISAGVVIWALADSVLSAVFKALRKEH